MDNNYILTNILASFFTASSVVGLCIIIFRNTITNLKEKISSLELDVKALEMSKKEMVDAKLYDQLRKDDRAAVEKIEQGIRHEIQEVKRKIELMPGQFADILKNMSK